MRLPNFFLIGAPRSGTTSLYGILGRHPDIFVSPVKEPRYFAPEVTVADGTAHRISDWHEYLALFVEATSQTAVGEGSPAYLSSATAPSAIAEAIPGARAIAILRNPVDRLFSYYKSAWGYGLTRDSFARWAFAERDHEMAGEAPHGRVRTGYYATHLGRWLRSIPRDRLHVSLFDDLLNDPSMLASAAFRFLGVDADRPFAAGAAQNGSIVPRFRALHRRTILARRVAKALLPESVLARAKALYHVRSRSTLDPKERAKVLQIYREEIEWLQEMLGRDLSAWLSF